MKKSLAFCLLALYAAPASAGDAAFFATIKQTGVMDTNPLLVARNRETIYGSVTTPSLTYRNQTPTTSLSATASVDENVFDKSKYNSTDLHGQTSLKQKNERWEAGFDGKIDYDTTRTSELSNFGLDVGAIRHFAYSLSPEVAFKPTQRDRIALNLSFTRAIYDSNLYSDYTLVSASPSYMRNLTPLTGAIFALQAQRYQSERDPKRRIDSIGPTVGFLTKLTQKFSLRGDVGSQATQQKGSQVTKKDWKWHYIFSTDFTYKDEVNEMALKASRARRPFGNGTDSLLTTFALEGDHDLNEKFSLTYGASYQFADYEEETGGNLDTMIGAHSGLAYHVLDRLDLNAGYRFRSEELTRNGGHPNQHIARLGLTFRYDFANAGR